MKLTAGVTEKKNYKTSPKKECLVIRPSGREREYEILRRSRGKQTQLDALPQ